MEESYKQAAASMQRIQVFIHLPAVVMASPSLFLMPQRGYMVKDRKARGNAQRIPDFSFSALLGETHCFWCWARRGKSSHRTACLWSHDGDGTKPSRGTTVAELVRAACSQNWKQGGHRHPTMHGLGGSLVCPVHQHVRGASQTLTGGDLKSFHFFPSRYCGGKPPSKVELLLGGIGWGQAAGDSARHTLQYSNQMLLVQMKYPGLRC